MFLVWVLVGIAILLFSRWLNNFLKQFNLPPDTHLLIWLAFTGISFVLALATLTQSDPSNESTPQQPTNAIALPIMQPPEVSALDQFENQHYPMLYGERQDVLKKLNELNIFFQNVLDLGNAMPAQRFFLQDIINNRWERKSLLKPTLESVDKSRRTFWMYYLPEKREFVRQSFDSEAEYLQQNLQTALGNALESQRAEESLIIDHLNAARKLLALQKIPSKVSQLKFESYLPPNRQRVLMWLEQYQETTILIQLNLLMNTEQAIQARLNYVQHYFQNNTDLKTEANTLSQEWQRALRYNHYAQYRILFAVEALMATQTLGYSVTTYEENDINQASRYVVGQLRESAQNIVAQAEAERISAEYSYQPAIERKYRTKNSTQN